MHDRVKHNAMNVIKNPLHKIQDWIIILSMKKHSFHLVWTNSTNIHTMIVVLYTNSRLQKIPHDYEAFTASPVFPSNHQLQNLILRTGLHSEQKQLCCMSLLELSFFYCNLYGHLLKCWLLLRHRNRILS